MTQKSFLEEASTEEARASNVKDQRNKNGHLPIKIRDHRTKYKELDKVPKDYLSQVELGKEMLEWIKQKINSGTLVTIDTFAAFKNYPPYKLKRIANPESENFNEEFKDYLDSCKLLVADALRTGCWIRKLDSNSAYKDMPMYDAEYRAYLKEMAKLKDQNQERGSITVVMENFPSSPMVKPRLAEAVDRIVEEKLVSTSFEVKDE
jgi:hypothetical protein